MEHALHLHAPHMSQRAVVPLVAFLIGGGAAVGTVALAGGLDSSEGSSSPPTVINVSPHGSTVGPVDQVSGARP
jgi:hypothetical protein